ncbi:cytochrome P450 [Sphingopyxis flava]|uniref:Cytochrome P450 n=1 Tax=Sphingopyxis flava TaxID=1507287 RepID=A0A1T5G2G3_9SPHN|nr:cytochrome P450 [Sphingopyxis flava]SKC02675.1 Cytochrome P450 [Sphingopyxis flava]
MNAIARISDFDDPGFDPFKTFDTAAGLFEIMDPWPRFHELAARGPVQVGSLREQFGLEEFALWSDVPSYMVFGTEAVTKAYLKAPTFSNEIMMRVYAESFGASINGMDAPEHTRYRRLFQQAFMPKQVLSWGSHLVPEVVNRLIDGFVGNGKADLVREFTSRYPFDVVYAQLGLPKDEGALFHKLAVGLMCIMVDYPHAVEASRKMGDYLLKLLNERRQGHGDDIVTMLAQAEVGGERLPDDIAVSFLRQLLNASGDTTYRGTSALLVGLLTNPDQLAAIRADRSLVDQAIDEALRWDGPLTAMTRQTLCDVELMGVTIPAGAKVDVVQATLNRDPSRYPDPDKFDIFREQKRHAAFALGPHVCIGQHLARIEMNRAVNALLDRLPNLRLDPDYPPPQIVGFNSRAPIELRVLFDS